jgi:DNA-binding MarR family transcriptional regulator/GNAT superfamily N-acetyltransferase
MHAAERAQVNAIRGFNRFYTRQIGVLRSDYLSSPFSATEARVLYELAHRQDATAGELAHDLDLDAGYLSRILQSFEKQGLLSRTPSLYDRRQAHLSLTDRGRKAFAPLDHSSGEESAGMLERLSSADRARLIEAMHTIESLLGGGAVSGSAGEGPAGEKPTAKKPSAEESPAKKLAAEELPVEKAATEDPGAEEPAGEKPAAEKLASKESPAEKLAAEDPTAEMPPAEESPAKKLAAEELPAEKAAPEDPAAEEPSAEKAPAKKLAAEELPAEKAAVEDPTAEDPTATKPSGEEPAAEKPSAEEPAPYVLRMHQPGDMGWVVNRHGALYAREYNWGPLFEALIAEIVARFLREFDASRERCWIAEKDGRNVGSIFLVKTEDEAVGQLRLLLVEPEARGFGIAKRLVSECVAFGREVGYRRIILLTEANLYAAQHIYEQVGFRLAREQEHRHFGVPGLERVWEMSL